MAASDDLLLQTARRLLRSSGALQSTAHGEDAVDETAIRQAATAFAEARAAVREDLDADVARAVAADAAHRTVGALTSAAPRLKIGDRGALQLIVRTFGRPALRLPGGDVEPPSNEKGDNELWSGMISMERDRFNERAACVGAMFLKAGGQSQFIGTGWRAHDGLVVTNRHVAAYTVPDSRTAPSSWAMRTDAEVSINFDHTDQPPSARIRPITELVFCSGESWLDMAVFRLGGDPPPPAMPLSFDPAAVGAGGGGFVRRKVYVVGHPYFPDQTPDVALVYGQADSLKRLSPGETTGLRDKDRAFEHDCSTLRGNSGSCVISAEAHVVIGLHFGGRDSDRAGVRGKANLAISLPGLKGHPVHGLLTTGKAA